MRVGSFFEWIAAVVGVAALVWLISVPVQRLMGPGVEAALGDEPTVVPPGIPEGAANIPVMYLLDGREIRHGDPHTQLVKVLPDELVVGPPVRSTSLFGDRYTRTYVVDGTRFFVVCERAEMGGPLRIAGIYLP